MYVFDLFLAVRVILLSEEGHVGKKKTLSMHQFDISFSPVYYLSFLVFPCCPPGMFYHNGTKHSLDERGDLNCQRIRLEEAKSERGRVEVQLMWKWIFTWKYYQISPPAHMCEKKWQSG